MEFFKLGILSIALLCVSCSSKGQKNETKVDSLAQASVKSKDQFQLLEFEQGGQTCYAMINLRYKDFNEKATYPWSLFITINTQQKGANILPTAEENKRLNSLEDSIINKLNTENNLIYIGRITLKGYRDIICYIKDTKQVSTLLNTLKKQNSDIIKYTFEEDPQWEAVEDLYHPEKTNNKD